jgi:hypothetical protein
MLCANRRNIGSGQLECLAEIAVETVLRITRQLAVLFSGPVAYPGTRIGLIEAKCRAIRRGY